MNKKQIRLLVATVSVTLLIILSICSIAKFYAKDKNFKMIYKLQENESVAQVAEKFDVDVKDIKLDGNYLMFEIKQ